MKKSTSDKTYHDFLDLCNRTDMAHLVDVAWFKYGKEGLEQWFDSEKYNSEDWEDLQYDLEQLDKFEDFVNNYDAYEDEKEEADPYHWKNRKKAMDKLMSAFDDL